MIDVVNSSSQITLKHFSSGRDIIYDRTTSLRLTKCRRHTMQSFYNCIPYCISFIYGLIMFNSHVTHHMYTLRLSCKLVMSFYIE